jgi:uncharacterized protein YjiS (DUF1127 family)
LSYQAVSLNAQSKLLPRPAAIAARLRALALEWQRRTRGRCELARLSHREIRDLGYSNCDVRAETRKPFWTP